MVCHKSVVIMVTELRVILLPITGRVSDGSIAVTVPRRGVVVANGLLLERISRGLVGARKAMAKVAINFAGVVFVDGFGALISMYHVRRVSR